MENELNRAHKRSAATLTAKERETRKARKQSPQYIRILEILDDYWLSEPDEEMVEVKMYFRKADGQEQAKRIVWRNREERFI